MEQSKNQDEIGSKYSVLPDYRWLLRVITEKVQENPVPAIPAIDSPPELIPANSQYASFVAQNQIQKNERLLLALAIAPHINPVFSDALKNMISSAFTEYDYMNILQLRSHTSAGYLVPTGLTFLYLVAGDDPQKRIEASSIFIGSNVLGRLGVIGLEPHLKGEPTLSGRLFISEKWLERFLYEREASKDSIKYWSLNTERKNADR